MKTNQPVAPVDSGHVPYMDRYIRLRNEILSQLKFILAGRTIHFIDPEQEEEDLDELMELPSIMYTNKHGYAQWYHITKLSLNTSGELEATGSNTDEGETMTFDEGNVSVYNLAFWLDSIHQGKFY